MTSLINLRHPKPELKLILDMQSKATADQNNLLAYTLLTLVVVVGLYFLTSDWKDIIAPEEVDLGSVRVVRRGRYRRKQDRGRPYDY